MKLSRLLILLLAAISACFIIFGAFEEGLSGVTIGLLTTATIILALPALWRSRGTLYRWCLVGASLTFTLLVLAALGLQFGQGSTLFVRASLCALMMLGALLCLRCCYQLNRPTRYGFHNYYDAPR
jgi:hypothetical protein